MFPSNQQRASILMIAFAAAGTGCVIPLETTGGDGGSGSGSGSSSGGMNMVPGQWVNVTGSLGGMPSECGNLSLLSAKPDEDMLIAGVSLRGLWAMRNGGPSWNALGGGPDAAVPITNRTSSVVYDPDPSKTGRFWESGIYNGGGAYVTTDDGDGFLLLGDSHHCDSISVDFSDPNRQTMVVGGHEQAQTLHRSTDGGMTWTSIGAGLPPMTNCTQALIIDANTYLVGCGGFGGGATGVYRTQDGGMSWTSQTDLGGAGTPLSASDGSIYWRTASFTASSSLARSTDHGQTWNSVAGDGVVASSPIELPDGRIATLAKSSVIVSADHGSTWNAASAALPYDDATGVVYSRQQKAFFIWHFTCGAGTDSVPTDAIQRFDFDYTKN